MEPLVQGFAQIFALETMAYLTAGVGLGVVLGAIPGLTATMAIAIVIPFTFTMPPVASMLMLLGAYKGGIFGGSIAAILVAAPGTPASAATVQDGYALARKGQSEKALKVALVSSVIADLATDVLLILLAVQLARIALAFGAVEYMIVAILGLTVVAAVSGRSLWKGVASAILGAAVALIGLDPMSGVPRFSFGVIDFYGGIELVPMLIGLLTLSEILVQIESGHGAGIRALPKAATRDDRRITGKDARLIARPIALGAVIGGLVGIIPGLGPTLGAFLGYDAAWRTSRRKEEFGKGSLEGIAGAEAGNNAVSGANLIPLLGLGIPGDTMAAILVGAFLIHGLSPGPLIFKEAPDVVYGLFAGLIVANLVLFVVARAMLPAFSRVARTPTRFLMPVVLMLCIVGAYGLNQSMFDVWVMLVFGLIGYVMTKLGFPRAPLLIGFILAPLMEENLRRALRLSDGDFSVFVGSPLAIGLWIFVAVSVALVLRQRGALRAEEGEVATETGRAS
ncbi:C4-dicarboxylate ABC transporter permease [Acuticoccus sediminis]|uniref:C4-dicarboxylate ABC transporter permease n=1 Tax=Acuticoccus sediminis TaxID=2184697 RepID=A0A8B2NIS0_9HYPH|nr:tripartite tricarboxylate transporter permease [Acuticoccus sediminis]RAH97411.1 C4-dicarboxylate ABC transporter permease [Acuticoccus sediminis]